MLLKFQSTIERPSGADIMGPSDLRVVFMTTHSFSGDQMAEYIDALAASLRSPMKGVDPATADLNAMTVVAEPLQHLLLTVTDTPELMNDPATSAAVEEALSALREARQFIERLNQMPPSRLVIPEVRWIDELFDNSTSA